MCYTSYASYTLLTDPMIEQVVGYEIYQAIQRSDCPEANRRILIVKFLYIHGFLESDFPATVQAYIPGHMREL